MTAQLPGQLTLAEIIQIPPEDVRPAANVSTPGLRLGGHLNLQERFEEWLETPEGRYLHREMVARARALYARGWRHYGAGALAEAIRFDVNVRVAAADGGFKFNNDYRSRLARRIMAEEPELDGFFETRALKA